jgi:hypothetical protein
MLAVLGEDGLGHFASQMNRALGHARELNPLAGELDVCFLKPHVRGPARGLLRGFRKLEIPRDSFFAIFVRIQTRTVRRAMTPVRG